MKKSEPPVTVINSLDLEFPDWSGMDDSSARITPETAFRLCEEYLRFAGPAQVRARALASEKCDVEFIL